MGLFGGFRAKFTKNAKVKETSEGIVILKYQVHSEFDLDYTRLPPSKDVKAPTVVRHRSHPTRPTVIQSNANETNIATTIKKQQSLSLHNLKSDLESVRISQPPKTKDSYVKERINNTSLSLNSFKSPQQISEADNISEPSQAKSILISPRDNTLAASNEELATSVKSSSTHSPEKNYQLSSMSRSLQQLHNSDEDDELITTIQEPVSNDVSQKYYNEASTLIFMTQHSSEVQENYGDSAGTSSTNSRASVIVGDDEDKNDFKVNIVQHSSTIDYATSEDETSYLEEEMSEYIPSGYSSQAASIFFGTDVTPTSSRPRRVRLRDSDSEDEKKNEEADC